MSAQERSAWAAGMIRRVGGTFPAYGSPDWLALPDGDPRKVAAVVASAEAWARDGDELEARLWSECIALSRAHKAAEDAECVDNAAAWREQWAGLEKLVAHPLAIARREKMRRSGVLG